MKPARLVRTVAMGVVVLAMIIGAYVCLTLKPQIYSAQADLYFLVPTSVRFDGNAFGEDNRSLIFFAGLVEREWDHGRGYPDLASPVAPLSATGLTSAVTVTLPNTAGQFERSFTFQKLIIQAIDPTQAGAQRRLDATIAALEEISRSVQQERNVRTDDFITTYVAPEKPAARATTGTPNRSIVAIGGIGVILIALINSRRRHRLADDVEPSVLSPLPATG